MHPTRIAIVYGHCCESGEINIHEPGRDETSPTDAGRTTDTESATDASERRATRVEVNCMAREVFLQVRNLVERHGSYIENT